MARKTVTMLMLHGGTPRDLEAREQLAAALPEDAEVSDPDNVGVFDLSLDAATAFQTASIASSRSAASGTDDHILFLEHPDLPEHWRPRSAAATA